MKKTILLFLMFLPMMLIGQNRLYFTSQPSLTPDASQIFFCYDGGIWSVPVQGGTAARVTAMTGYQSAPHVSPDGRWLAFSADEQGNNDVYVTPVDGGEIRQLTFHQASDIVSGWSPDSKYIYFESGRFNGRTTYKVSLDGGTPVRLFPGYFNTVVHMAENPVDGTVYFNETSESFNAPTRKGYKGDNAPQILSWNAARKEYNQLTEYRGKDMWPSVDQNGVLYWATDEKHDEYNLVRYENGTPRIVTDFTTGIRQPKVSYNGAKVVFTKDYAIQVYDVASGTVTTPTIRAFDSNHPDIEYSYSTDGKISGCDISPDGKKLAFISRGRLFVSDTKGFFVKELDTDPSERVMEVSWAKDNKTLYYTRTRNGWYNIYKISAEDTTGEKSVYTPDHMITTLTASHDRSVMAFITGSRKIELLRPDTDKVEKVSDNEFWSFQRQSISFSQDDKYMAYTAMNLFDRDIFVYNLETKSVINLTNSASTENSPAWSADGRYLYLTANRHGASFPRGNRSNLFRIKLDYTQAPYVTDKYRELFRTDTTKSAQPGVTIDTRDILRRWEPVQTSGSQGGVQIYKNGSKSYLVYASNHEGSYAMYVQELLDFDQKPAKKIAGLTSVSSLTYDGKQLYGISQGAIYSIDLAGASSKKIEIKQNFSRNNRDEFNQMFYEVWTLISENFYDPALHGVDWNQKQDYYAGFLPYVKSRQDLRTLINDLLGELNSSHLGFSSNGTEERRATTMRTLETGILFSNEKPYIVDTVLRDSPAHTVDRKIRPGDELTAVNGVKVDPSVNRESYFVTPAATKELTLTFRRANATYDVTLNTANPGTVNNLLYTAWEDDCRNRVTQATGGRVAYHHMRDMTDGSLNRFLIDMHTDAVHKDALILDLRYNNGGNVHDEVLEFLSRKQHFTWKYRDHQTNTHPNVTPGDKPIVVLINERSLSDAEVTSNGVRELGIAKLVGTETYRWIIFTSGAMLVDGSYCRLPAWGCYNLQGEDMEFAGVAPDIYIRNTFVDRMNGGDPQLDRAIEEILKELPTKK